MLYSIFHFVLFKLQEIPFGFDGANVKLLFQSHKKYLNYFIDYQYFN